VERSNGSRAWRKAAEVAGDPQLDAAPGARCRPLVRNPAPIRGERTRRSRYVALSPAPTQGGTVAGPAVKCEEGTAP
jgi:hypothetical protein